MNTYIQAIVDKYDKAGCFIEWETTFSKEDLQDALTDYHNHIVEKMHEHVENMYHPGTWEYNECGDFVNSFYEKINLLQDTNPKE